MRIVCALLGLAAAASAAKSPITHEAVWLMKRVGAPVVSPDGRWVVFPVTEPAYDEKFQVADLWIVPAEGGLPPRRLTSTRSGESGVAWSPDSARIAFSAKREGDEASQIYLLDVAGGGEALRVTSVSSGATAPLWRPDGRAIAFTSSVYPGSAEERKARKYNARVYESFPIRYWDKWLDDSQPGLFVQTLEPGAKSKDILAGTRLAADPGFAGTQTDSGEELRAAWTPDGAGLVFAAAVNRNQSAYAFTKTHLFHLSANGGEARQITSGEDSYSRPAFTPDGKSLYALHQREGPKTYSLTRLAMFRWPDPTERTIVTASFDRSVSTFGIAPDGRSIYLLAEEAGHEKLYTVDARGGSVRPTIDTSKGVYTNLSVAAKSANPVLLANWESAVNPAEVVRLDPAAKTHRALSALNTEKAESIDLQPLRHFTFTSKRGKTIHNMIALPPGFDESKKYPLFVLIHGGANLMWRDHFFTRWNYHLLASPGYVVLLTNYTGSTGFGEKFAQEIEQDPLAGPGEELNEAADEAIRRFGFIDGSRQAAGGASYGGHLANWLQATTTRYKCLISHAGLINLESQWGTSDTIYHREINNGGPPWEQGTVWREQNPIRRAKNFRTPMLLTVGEHDFRVPLNQTLENWSVLQRMRVPSRLVVFPDANHWIMKGEDSRYFYQEVLGWLKKYL